MKIDSIEIVEKGKYNSDKKYWPFRLKISGNYKENRVVWSKNRFGSIPEVKNFNVIKDFYFYKDDYDKWQVIIKELFDEKELINKYTQK